MEIGAYVKKLNIGINFSYNKSKQKEETYTFTIEYYDLDTVMANALKKVEQVKKNEVKKLAKIKKRIHIQDKKQSDLLKSETTFNPNLLSSDNETEPQTVVPSDEDVYGDTNIFDDTNVYRSTIQTSLSFEEDDDDDDLDEIDVKLAIVKQEKRKGKNQSKYIRQISDIVDDYVSGLGLQFEYNMWKSNKENKAKCNSRCKWIQNTCDIDYFLRDIGIL